MLLWHLGTATAIVYVTLGRRRIDYRFILVGAVVPDLLDGLLGLFLFDGDAGRWVAHSLLTVIVVAVAIILGLKGERRLAVFGIAVGWLLHLVADGMWEAPKTFLWPAFGRAFASVPGEPYSWDVLVNPWDHLSTWAAEVAGLGILAWFFVAFELNKDERLKLFVKDGYLRP